MTRCCDDACLDAPEVEGIAVIEQPVELAAVGGEAIQVVNTLERVLYLRYPGADGRSATDLFLNIRCAAEMIGMDVRFEDPVDLEVLFTDEGNDRIGRVCTCAAGGRVEVENRVDDRRVARIRVTDDVGDGVGCLVEEGVYLWIGHRLPRWLKYIL